MATPTTAPTTKPGDIDDELIKLILEQPNHFGAADDYQLKEQEVLRDAKLEAVLQKIETDPNVVKAQAEVDAVFKQHMAAYKKVEAFYEKGDSSKWTEQQKIAFKKASLELESEEKSKKFEETEATLKQQIDKKIAEFGITKPEQVEALEAGQRFYENDKKYGLNKGINLRDYLEGGETLLDQAKKQAATKSTTMPVEVPKIPTTRPATSVNTHIR